VECNWRRDRERPHPAAARARAGRWGANADLASEKGAGALGSRRSALIRDECGDWRIGGNRGHIYAVPGPLCQPHTSGFQNYFGRAGVEKGWLNTKREMDFAKVMQDGDVDGCMFMGRLPTKGEAEVIRSRLDILKKREVGEQELERLRTQMARFNAQREDA
jgi:hypothetical protein